MKEAVRIPSPRAGHRHWGTGGSLNKSPHSNQTAIAAAICRNRLSAMAINTGSNLRLVQRLRDTCRKHTSIENPTSECQYTGTDKRVTGWAAQYANTKCTALQDHTTSDDNHSCSHHRAQYLNKELFKVANSPGRVTVPTQIPNLRV